MSCDRRTALRSCIGLPAGAGSELDPATPGGQSSTLHAVGGYDFGEPIGTLGTFGTVVDPRTCSWERLFDGIATFDVPIEGLQTDDRSTLHFQFDLVGPHGHYPFVVDVPGVYSD